MKTLIAFLGVGAALLSGAMAWAQSKNPNVAYQQALLGRPETPQIHEFCTAKLGEKSDDNEQAFTACKVTRFFVSDVLSKRTKNVPPMANPDFITDDEAKKIADALGLA